MTSIIQRRPVTEPVTVSDLRTYLRLAEEDESLLQELLVSARLLVEAYTGQRLIRQVWSQVIAYQPHGYVSLLHWPVSQLRSITVLGDLQVTLDTQKFQLVREARPVRVRPTSGAWYQLRHSQYGFSFEIEVGYGSEQVDVPEDLRQAIMSLAAHWYETQEWNDRSPRNVMPAQVADLLQPHRLIRIS